MNSKAIRKQLLAAVAMVLVAAVALGSSTYAWFVASGTVTAEGMQVKAQAEGNLVIRHTTKNWGTVATADTNDNIALKPTSTFDFSTWVHSSAKEPGAYTSDGKYEVITNTVKPTVDDGGTSNGYALVKQFFIRSATKENTPMGLYVDKINVTVGGKAPKQNLSSSLRVGIKCSYNGVSKTFIYGPVGTDLNAPAYGSIKIDESTTINGVHMPTAPDATGTVELADMTGKAITLAQVGKNGDTPKTAILASDITIPGPKDPTNPNASSSSSDAVEVFIYVWFEGEDTHLYSDNFATETMDVSVEFQSITTSAAAGG